MLIKTVAIVLFTLFVVVTVYEVFSPYTVWYFIVPNTRLVVGGKEEYGRLHRGNHDETLFLTRRNEGKAESYMIWLPRDQRGTVSSCGRWTAPCFPAFPIAGLIPPCWTFFRQNTPTRIPVRPETS